MLVSERKKFNSRFVKGKVNDSGLSIPKKAQLVKETIENKFAEYGFKPGDDFNVRLEQNNRYNEQSINARIYVDGELVGMMEFGTSFFDELDSTIQQISPDSYLEHYTSSIIDFWIHE